MQNNIKFQQDFPVYPHVIKLGCIMTTNRSMITSDGTDICGNIFQTNLRDVMLFLQILERTHCIPAHLA